jgi:hypothetical protein
MIPCEGTKVLKFDTEIKSLIEFKLTEVISSMPVLFFDDNNDLSILSNNLESTDESTTVEVLLGDIKATQYKCHRFKTGDHHN